MTSPSTATARDTDLALARLHLRLGSLALARAELETMAGRDALDADGLVDLAEARWRTGDVIGAGEAAATIISDDADGIDGPLVALVIAAEAALARGRPTEARRYANRAMEVVGGSIDPVFAGMPRGPVWPADATVLPAPAPTLFETPIAGSAVTAAAVTRAASGAGADVGGSDVAGPGSGSAGPPPVEPATLALWGALEATPGTEVLGPTAAVESASSAAEAAAISAAGGDPDGQAAFDRGVTALAAGDLADAALGFGLALRLAPALAAAVLDAIDGRPERELALVRGDAYRLVGREVDARRAFADAARTDHLPTDPMSPPSEGDPA